MSQVNKFSFPDNKFDLYFLAYDSPKSVSHGNHWTDREGIVELTHNYGRRQLVLTSVMNLLGTMCQASTTWSCTDIDQEPRMIPTSRSRMETRSLVRASVTFASV